MNISVKGHDEFIQIHFGRRSGVCLEPIEAELLRRQLIDTLAGESGDDGIDLGIM